MWRSGARGVYVTAFVTRRGARAGPRSGVAPALRAQPCPCTCVPWSVTSEQEGTGQKWEVGSRSEVTALVAATPGVRHRIPWGLPGFPLEALGNPPGADRGGRSGPRPCPTVQCCRCSLRVSGFPRASAERVPRHPAQGSGNPQADTGGALAAQRGWGAVKWGAASGVLGAASRGEFLEGRLGAEGTPHVRSRAPRCRRGADRHLLPA